MLLVNWLNKFLFANVIQTHFEAARVINSITEGCKLIEAIDYFDYITENCDFHNVFASMKYCTILPDETWNDLVQFNQLLLECDISQLGSEFSHKILEDGISTAKRQIAGQYPTPEALAKLMSEIGIRNAFGASWDCCCGTGTIGRALWERKRNLLTGVSATPEEDAFGTTWMSDIHDFPLQIATQTLASSTQVRRPLLVFCKNVFSLFAGQPLPFTDPLTGDTIEYELPEFDAIVSNLPFVDFNTSEIGWYDSAKEAAKTECRDRWGIDLSDRNDLYCYITLFLESFLAENGHLCLLTSNSWLCTSAGEGFMEALKHSFEIEGIYVNGRNRWFNNSDVMNALLVLGKKKETTLGTYMGVINASIEDLGREDVRRAISSSIIVHDGVPIPCFNERFLSWDAIRVLKKAGISYYTMCHDVAFLQDIMNRLCRVETLFAVSRGTKSGQDRFFYSSDPDFVDSIFRRDLLKNFEEVDSYELRTSGYAFCCDKSEEYLADNGFEKTLQHIHSVTTPNQSCLGHRPYWYTLPNSEPFTFATMMNPYERLFFAGVPKGAEFVANQRAICFRALDPSLDKELCLALLNSTLGMFLIEASAAPMALGALDTRSETFSKMYMLDPGYLDEKNRNKIVESFAQLKSRPIKDALSELEEPDRREFDNIVLESYGIEKYERAIIAALKGLLHARLRR